MRLQKILKIPRRVRQFGLLGLLFLAVVAFLKFIGEAILEQEIQEWWQGLAKPFLISPTPIEIQFQLQGWVIVSLLILLLAGGGGIVYGIARIDFGRAEGIYKLSGALNKPKDLDSTQLTPTDVVNAIVEVRKGTSTPEFLVNEIVMKAVNSSVIRPEAAAETLEEFGYELILRSDGSWSFIRQERRQSKANETS